MEFASEIGFCHIYPETYKVEIKQECFEDILQLFVDEILQGSSCDKAETALVNYVCRIIEPIGWSAVWQTTKKSTGNKIECDLLVEVNNVSLEKLEADVFVKSLVAPSGCDAAYIQRKFKSSEVYSVPLIELYPVSEQDEEEMYAKTAVVIEHVRLFYQHLHRPWDIEDDETFYSEKILRPRLELYFAMKNKTLPEIIATKIQGILNEGWTIMSTLKTMYKSMNMSDSEVELSDEDVYVTYELRKKIKDLQRDMDILENPDMRRIMMDNYIIRKSPVKAIRSSSAPVTTIVATDFTYEMIMNLKLQPDTHLKFEDSPEIAIKTCCDGDTLLIFPGVYRCDTFGWLENTVTIKGIGPYGSVQIHATGYSEVFMNCDCQSVLLENITFLTAENTKAAVVIHHGSVTMKNCEIGCDNSDVGITLLGGTELIMEDCKLANAKEDGIQLRPSSNLKMTRSKVVFCGKHGIQIDVDDTLYINEPVTEISLVDSCISNNDGYGIYVNTAPSRKMKMPFDEFGDFFVLNLFPWLKHNIQNSLLCHNKHSGIGSGPTYKFVKHVLQS